MFGIAAIGTGIEAIGTGIERGSGRGDGRWDRREDVRSMTGVHLAKLEEKFIRIRRWEKTYMVKYLRIRTLRSPSSYMTVQLLHSEFPFTVYEGFLIFFSMEKENMRLNTQVYVHEMMFRKNKLCVWLCRYRFSTTLLQTIHR
jgi:hypothetical protein